MTSVDSNLNFLVWRSTWGLPPPVHMRPPEPDPLRVDVINEWPLVFVNAGHLSFGNWSSWQFQTGKGGLYCPCCPMITSRFMPEIKLPRYSKFLFIRPTWEGEMLLLIIICNTCCLCWVLLRANDETSTELCKTWFAFDFYILNWK